MKEGQTLHKSPKDIISKTVDYKKNGISVISAYRPLYIADSEMLLITEIPEDNIYSIISDMWYTLSLIIIITLLAVIPISLFFANRINIPLRKISSWLEQIAEGKKVNCHVFLRTYALDKLSRSVMKLNNSNTLQRKLQAQQQWLEQSLSGLYEEMNGVMKLDELCNKVTIFLAKRINSPAAAMYLIDNDWTLSLKGQYGCPEKGGYLNVLEKCKGGVLLEAAKNIEIIELTDLPENFFRIKSAHLNQKPDSVFIMPFCYGQMIKGIMVFACISGIKKRYKKLLSDTAPPIANAVHSLELTVAGADNAAAFNNYD